MLVGTCINQFIGNLREVLSLDAKLTRTPASTEGEKDVGRRPLPSSAFHVETAGTLIDTLHFLVRLDAQFETAHNVLPDFQKPFLADFGNLDSPVKGELNRGCEDKFLAGVVIDCTTNGILFEHDIPHSLCVEGQC